MENKPKETIYDTFAPNLYKLGVSTYSSDLPATDVVANSSFSTGVDQFAQSSTSAATGFTQQQIGGSMAGKTKFDNTETGYILGIDSSVPKFYIGNTTNYLNWTGTQLIVSGNITATTGTIGGFTIGANSLYAGTGATRIQLDTTQGVFMGSNTFATAPTRISLNGTAHFSSVSLDTDVVLSGLQAGSSLAIQYLTAGSITSKAITLAVADGTGDSYIAAGKTDFTNSNAGFILGIDDSDSNKAKFYIGDSAEYLNWDGTTLLYTGKSRISLQVSTIFETLSRFAYYGTGKYQILIDYGLSLIMRDPFGATQAGSNANVTVTLGSLASLKVFAESTFSAYVIFVSKPSGAGKNGQFYIGVSEASSTYDSGTNFNLAPLLQYGFKVIMVDGVATLYATNSNQTNETSTSIQTLTYGEGFLFTVSIRSDSKIEYYLNNTLVATHTTNIPSSNGVTSSVGIVALNNANSNNFYDWMVCSYNFEKISGFL